MIIWIISFLILILLDLFWQLLTNKSTEKVKYEEWEDCKKCVWGQNGKCILHFKTYFCRMLREHVDYFRKVKTEPRYNHDCNRCEFLGTHEEYDLYFCPDEPTIIARYGNEDGEYGSGLVFAVSCSQHEKYKKALRLALKTKHRDSIIQYFEKYYRFESPEKWERFQQILKKVDSEALNG